MYLCKRGTSPQKIRKMTDKIKDWRLRLIIWLEKRWVKEKQSELQNFKESVLLGLQQLETEESIEVFNKINEEYKNLMLKRLARVTKEKFDLEEFLSVS